MRQVAHEVSRTLHEHPALAKIKEKAFKLQNKDKQAPVSSNVTGEGHAGNSNLDCPYDRATEQEMI
jgi:hypothetical protein